MPASTVLRRFAVTAACLLLASSAAVLAGGCDSRAREIRGQLSDADLLRFDRGQKVSSPCWACHDFYEQQNKVGPYLTGVFGRQAGTANFPGYSEALRRSRIVWSRDTLRRYIASPQQAVPGTNMVSPGVPSASDLDALLFYMEQVTR